MWQHNFWKKQMKLQEHTEHEGPKYEIKMV